MNTGKYVFSINLMVWAEGKYERGAVKMHTLIDLR